MIVVDTSVWVQYLRTRGSPAHLTVDGLLAQEEVAMVGPVLAEILQGARTQEEFQKLHEWLTALPYLEDTQEAWARAGAISYELRQRGLAVAVVDLLIAALAMEHGHQLYTLDEHFRRIPGLEMHPM